MKSFKKWVISFLAINAILFAMMTILVYVMDPLQYFRPISFYKPVYSFDKRLAIPGIIRNYEYESLIIGSSTAQNFKPSQVESLFGLSCVKLTSPGASGKELSIMFEEAAKHQDVKVVIQGIDSFAYAGQPSRLRTQLPSHLYKLNPRNFYKYFYDGYTIKKILTKTDWTTVFDSKKYTFDHDRFAYNGDKKKPSYQRTVNTFYDSNYSASYCDDSYSKESKESFRQNVIDLAKQHTNTVFNLYFSPSSILDWLIREKNGDLDDILKFRSFVTDQCMGLDNVNIFDFQADKNITHNLNIYYDITHYDETINELIIKEIHSGNYKTDPQKCKLANNEILKQIEQFNAEVLPTIEIQKE